MELTVGVKGLREVEQRLLALGGKQGTAVLRRAMLKAAQPITDQAKANVAAFPRGSGALHQAIGARFVAEKSAGGVMFLPPLGGRFKVEVAPRRNDRTAVALYNLAYRRRTSRIFHGHLVEFGFTAKSGKRVPARPYLKPALERRSVEAVKVLADEIHAGIERLLK